MGFFRFGLVVGVFCSACAFNGQSNADRVSQNIENTSTIEVSSATKISDLYEDTCFRLLAEARNISIAEGTARAIEEYSNVINGGCGYHAGVRMALGLALASAGRSEEATVQYREVITRYPNNWAAHWTLAQTLILELNQFEEGEKEVKISQRLDDLGSIGYLYDYFLGRAYEGMNKRKEALDHFRSFEKRQSKVNKNDEKLVDARARISKLERL